MREFSLAHIRGGGELSETAFHSRRLGGGRECFFVVYFLHIFDGYVSHIILLYCIFLTLARNTCYPQPALIRHVEQLITRHSGRNRVELYGLLFAFV